jgi:hypothetical protein
MVYWTRWKRREKQTVSTTQLIYGPKRCEVTGDWRKLHNGEHYDMNFSSNNNRVIISTRMWWGRHVIYMGHRTGTYRLSAERPEGDRPLGRPRRRWLENIKMDLFFCFVPRTTIAQLIHKLSHSYMFRHDCVILKELVINTLPSYTSISNAAVGNAV